MKITTVIDTEREEEVVLYAHRRDGTVERIEDFVASLDNELYGYRQRDAVRLDTEQVEYFFSQDGRVYARLGGEELSVRERMYTLEQMLNAEFVRINQSCLVNIKKISRFETSLGGALIVVLKSGYRDYVSRRQMKNVKERLGIR